MPSSEVVPILNLQHGHGLAAELLVEAGDVLARSLDLGTTMDHVARLDSTGLRTIFSARDRYAEQGRQFALTPGSQQVERLLTVTRAGEHLNTIASVDAPAGLEPQARSSESQ
jgi:anti-anti-sigma regulatory factor